MCKVQYGHLIAVFGDDASHRLLVPRGRNARVIGYTNIYLLYLGT